MMTMLIIILFISIVDIPLKQRRSKEKGSGELFVSLVMQERALGRKLSRMLYVRKIPFLGKRIFSSKKIVEVTEEIGRVADASSVVLKDLL